MAREVGAGEVRSVRDPGRCRARRPDRAARRRRLSVLPRGLAATSGGCSRRIDDAVRAAGRPFLGICVGMQMLPTRGLEYGPTDGLGWIGGEVVTHRPRRPDAEGAAHGLERSGDRPGRIRCWRASRPATTPISSTPTSSAWPIRRTAWRMWTMAATVTAIVGAGQHRRRAVPPRKEPGDRAAADRQLPDLGPDGRGDDRLQAILDEIATRRMAAPRTAAAVADYIPAAGAGRSGPVRHRRRAVRRPGRARRAMRRCRSRSRAISKVFTLAIALGRLGDRLWNRVGREPSGQAFNSILQLENEERPAAQPVHQRRRHRRHRRHPRRPRADARFWAKSCASSVPRRGRPGHPHQRRGGAVEAATGDRNFALAHFMRAHRQSANNPPDLTLGAYFHQCAIEMSCVQLARAGRFLTNAPERPAAGRPPPGSAGSCALMMMCGHYDASGDFAYRVGLPGKSGVGGGILVIAPGRASIAVWSPGLNPHGNSQARLRRGGKPRPPHRLVGLRLTRLQANCRQVLQCRRQATIATLPARF